MIRTLRFLSMVTYRASARFARIASALESIRDTLAINRAMLERDDVH
jgi:hypothetical protein